MTSGPFALCWEWDIPVCGIDVMCSLWHGCSFGSNVGSALLSLPQLAVEGAWLAPRMAVITAQKTDRGQFLFLQVSSETGDKGDERAVWRGRDRECNCGIGIVAFPRALRVVEHDRLAPCRPAVRGPAIFGPASDAVATVNLARNVAVEGDDVSIGALGQAVAAVTGPTVLLVIDVRGCRRWGCPGELCGSRWSSVRLKLS